MAKSKLFQIANRVALNGANGETVRGFDSDCGYIIIGFESGKWLCLRAKHEGDWGTNIYDDKPITLDELYSLRELGIITGQEYTQMNAEHYAHQRQQEDEADRAEYERLKRKFGTLG